ncbi:hypothetical protein BD626DRAFT_486142 [Schizophyllum amplum]|uniref:Uncharacterized protein n=1 Tax=Schizophyllum amplum TaxID=97359 RepID=A0A550CM86_9AGAR|nr:hypothetical protein BD626DRAFT_486142 [Auriculariopsis ampla]
MNPRGSFVIIAWTRTPHVDRKTQGPATDGLYNGRHLRSMQLSSDARLVNHHPIIYLTHPACRPPSATRPAPQSLPRAPAACTPHPPRRTWASCPDTISAPNATLAPNTWRTGTIRTWRTIRISGCARRKRSASSMMWSAHC